MTAIGSLLTDGALAAVAAMGFAVISDPSKRTIPFCALLAALGHMARYSLMHFAGWDIMTASFVGALVIGITCIAFAYWLHTPTTTLYIPALLPMIPGMYAYRTIFALLQFMRFAQDQEQAMRYMLDFFVNGVTTFTVVFVMAVGASIPTFWLRKWCFSMTRANRYKSLPQDPLNIRLQR